MKEYSLDRVEIKLTNPDCISSKEPIKNVDIAVKLLSEIMIDMDREHFIVINLRADLTPINYSITAIGTLSAVLISPREILKSSILSNAASIICIHNHVSGNLHPSDYDLNAKERLKEAGKIMDIPLTDFIIMGKRSYLSFANEGYL